MLAISIIVCTYNGKSRLLPTLTHIQRLYLQGVARTELILVDNNSSDGTGDWCKAWLQKNNFPFAWRVVYEPNSGLSHARLRGIQEAQYDLLLFCDDDNHLQRDYLQIGAALMAKNQSWGVLGGHGEPLFEARPPAWFQRFHYSYAVGSQAERSGVLPYGSQVYGAACFFRKKALQEVLDRGFQSQLSDRKGTSLSSGGDVEYCYILQLHGWRVAYEERLKFKHYMPAARFTEAYYLKLKAAIASQSARMFPYHYLFETGSVGERGFVERLKIEKLKAGFRYRLFQIKQLFRLSKGTCLEKQVAKVNLKNKYLAFTRDRDDAVVIYRRLVYILYNIRL